MTEEGGEREGKNVRRQKVSRIDSLVLRIGWKEV